MKIGYFPGCSLHSTANEFDQSLKAILGPLDVELDEIQDWACCGATSGHATNHLLSIALPARTLAQAEKQSHQQVLAPCAACYSRLSTAHHELRQDPALASRVHSVLGGSFRNTVGVLSIAEFLRNLAPRIKESVKTPLSNVKIACYYGCLLVRPPSVTGFDDAEMPTSMEEIVRATGAEAVNWRLKVDCCGGGFSLSRTGSVVRLGRAIIDDAKKSGAQAIVVACPMCHSNLDLRQKAMAARGEAPLDMPILFITQLVGLAFGIAPAKLGLNRHFVGTQRISAQAGGAV